MTVALSKLSGGLRVVSDSMDSVETVTLGAWIEVGTRDEDAKNNGISHLLEHMAFKGTDNRSAKQIVEEIETVGGHLNAYTSRDHTAYYAKVLKENASLAIEIVADILQHSTLDEVELEREKKVIIQEIHQSLDTPDDVVFDYFQETAFPNQAIGRPVLGTEILVRSLTPDILKKYMAEHYSSPHIVLAAAGNIEHDALVELVQNAFKVFPEEIKNNRDPAIYIGGDRNEIRDLEQSHVLFGMEGISFTDDDFHALSVFSTLLGGGMSSRLFQEIREKRGLAYNIYSYIQCYVDSGLFGIYAGTGKENIEILIPLIKKEIEKLCLSISEDEIIRARTQIKSSLLMSLESTSSRCEQVARQTMIYGHPLSLNKVIANIESVNEASLKCIGERLLMSKPTLTTLGPN
ncbi:MAG: pitrilysin family protein [Pseudomonadota bacterium]|nr:pitrilysin family protein [Pseudomonadota bacterium]